MNLSGADGEEETLEEEAVVVERPRKRTKREPTNTEVTTTAAVVMPKSASSTQKVNKKSNTSTGTKKRQQKRKDLDQDDEDEEMDEKADVMEDRAKEEEKEEEEEQAEELNNLTSSPLVHLTTHKYGRIFESEQQGDEEKNKVMKRKQNEQVRKRVNLPTMLIYCICDFLPLTSLVTLAHISRSSYATVREYGEACVLGESKRSCSLDPLGDDIEFIGSVAGPLNLHHPHRGFSQRSLSNKGVDIRTLSDLTQLSQSQLRHLVTSMNINCLNCNIDSNHLRTISTTLPHLRCLVLVSFSFSLQFIESAEKKSSSIVLPKFLRSLTLSLQLEGAPQFKMDSIRCIGSAISVLTYLNEFRLMESMIAKKYASKLMTFITKVQRLRLFHSALSDLICRPHYLMAFPSTLTSVSQIARQTPVFDALRGPSIPQQLYNFKCFIALEQEYIEPLSRFASTLISISPPSWKTREVTWLSVFTQLRILTLITSFGCCYSPTEMNDEIKLLNSIRETFRIDMQELVTSLSQLTRLTRLRLFVHRLDNQQFETILKSLTSLQHLSIGSDEVTSIAFFPRLSHLVNQLDTLMLRLPKLPRNEVVHLYSLRWLSLLDIVGSFTEPLFLRQLLPLQSPSQQQPYLRKFIPRSEKEAIPVPPIDLATQEKERSEFNERVRLGQVSAAEMIHSDQLSLAFQQLDVKEFSFAARTCRSWRAAASQRNAWSSGTTGRILVLEGISPECDPNILPHLPLWRYARRVRFYPEGAPPRHPGIRLTPSMIDGLAAILLLSRLESLDLHSPYQSVPEVFNAIRSFLSQLAPRLIRLCINGPSHVRHRYSQYSSSIKAVPLQDFIHLQHLDVIGGGHFLLPNWQTMVELESITMNQLPSGWADSLRRISLSSQHRFRQLRLDMTNYSGVRELTSFLHELSGRPQILGQIQTISSPFDKAAASENQQQQQNQQNQQPAAISLLHITITQPLESQVLDLPCGDLSQLLDLRIEITNQKSEPSISGVTLSKDGWNFAPFNKPDSFQSLERFYYDGPLYKSELIHLAQAKRLRFLTLIDRWYMLNIHSQRGSWLAQNFTWLPEGCMTEWLKSWTRLEEFHLEGIRVIGSELKEFSRVSETLRSFHLHHVSTTALETFPAQDFSFLPSCSRLESLELKCISGLTLIPTATPRREYTAAATSAAATASTQSNISSDPLPSLIIEYIRSCPSLREFTWCLHPCPSHDLHVFASSNESDRLAFDSDQRQCERDTLKTLRQSLHQHSTNTPSHRHQKQHTHNQQLLTIRYMYITNCGYKHTHVMQSDGTWRFELRAVGEKINIEWI